MSHSDRNHQEEPAFKYESQAHCVVSHGVQQLVRTWVGGLPIQTLIKQQPGRFKGRCARLVSVGHAPLLPKCSGQKRVDARKESSFSSPWEGEGGGRCQTHQPTGGKAICKPNAASRLCFQASSEQSHCTDATQLAAPMELRQSLFPPVLGGSFHCHSSTECGSVT